MNNFSGMNVTELKDLCRVHGLAISGRKKDIIDRLKEFVANEPVWGEIERPIKFQHSGKSLVPIIHSEKCYCS